MKLNVQNKSSNKCFPQETQSSQLLNTMDGWWVVHVALFNLLNIYGTLQYQATFLVDIFFFSGSVLWLSIFMEMDFLQNSESLFLFIQCAPQKIKVSAFRRNLGYAPYAQNLVYFPHWWNSILFFCFNTQLVKKLH